MRISTILAAAVLTVTATIAPATAAVSATAEASANGGVGIQLVPEAAGASGRDQAYIVARPDAGTTVSRTVEVSNTSTVTQNVSVSVGAATIRDGSFVGQNTNATNDLTKWTRLDAAEITLKPGATKQVVVDINVPATAAAGERYGAVWAAVQTPTTSAPVTTVNRVGIRMYVSVDQGAMQPDFAIRNLDTSHHNGRTRITATVENTGDLAIDLTGELRFKRSGLTAGPYAGTSVTTIAPGSTDTVRITAGAALPAGRWHTTATITNGSVTKTATAMVTVPNGNPTADAAPDNTLAIWVIGSALTLAVLILVLVLVLLRKRRRQLPTP
ncbi:hypothetical protein [Curtobacterium sp. VKM Ac-1376]|uniref:hypothetical protein n=1 Tax=Curtobacterium sp. VKM Ac-1376 TaxID=123312 RepID=UPI00188D131D|nr:hypothetical protein [Curtobacterium sp. VKM Ac-1376]MBF4615950.1 hypothetical protein [Curtobacterium sp. VKM Ac-1376]